MPNLRPGYGGRDPQQVPYDDPDYQRLVDSLVARSQGASRQTKELVRYTSFIPRDYEGLLQLYTQFHGPEGTRQMLQQLPKMNWQQLRELQSHFKDIGNTSDEQFRMLVTGAGGPR